MARERARRLRRGRAGAILAGGVVVFGAAALGAMHSPLAAGAAGAVAAVVVGVLVSWRRPQRASGGGAAIPAPPVAGMSYELLLERLPEPVVLVTAEEDIASARIAFTNAAAREIFPNAAGGPLLAAAIRNAMALEAIEEALAGSASEREIEGGGAQDRTWRVLGRPLPVDRGSAALVVFRDETEIRRVERLRADFLANASHELRTPLASLSGFIETLRGPARDDEVARDKFLGIMNQQAGRMRRLINDLLSLSRIELNEHIAPDGVTDLTAVVRDIIDAAGPDTSTNVGRVELDLPPIGEALVRGDRDQLIQVAQNLIDNAIKYAGPEGVVRVEVRPGVTAAEAIATRRAGAARLSILSPDHAAGQIYGLISVSDSGPGIARENLARLSERFYRVEGQKSGERLGTGLGLAIVKHIMNRHKGGLVVESVLGEGATFTAYAPVAEPRRTPPAG